MNERFIRTELLLGKNAMEKLRRSRVAVFGIGGVGGYAVEALARSGVGAIDLIDNDKVSLSNVNRQIYATDRTVGLYKVDVAKERILSINPECMVRTYKVFYLPEIAKAFDLMNYDYIIDAIDTVTGKLALARNAKECSVPMISSMGAGNKLDPTKFEVADISETSVCPLARTMRRELKKLGVESLKVVYSKEQPVCLKGELELSESGRVIPGSTAFVPSVAGLIIAGEVIKDLISLPDKMDKSY